MLSDKKMPSQPIVTISLIDFKDSHNHGTVGEIFEKLSETIRKQQEGRVKWFENREKKFGDFIPIEFFHDMEYIEKHHLFNHAPEHFKSNREFVLKGVKHDGNFLYSVSVEFGNDPEVVMAAVKQNALSLGASERLKGDREFILQVVKE